MAETQTFIGTLEVHTCGECGIIFGMTTEFKNQKRKDHTVWFCPNGHERIFTGKTEADKLKEELATKDRSIEYLRNANNSLHTQLTQQKHIVRSQKAAKTRLKNRVKNGVCPCCNRTFSNLLNHMKTQHPDYQKS